MMSNKPYLIKAICQWCNDHDLTTHILVSAEYEGINVPMECIEDSRIVLNISDEATRDLNIAEEVVEFLANFNQSVVKVSIPVEAVIAVYAHETGEGITFEEEEDGGSNAFSEADIDIGISGNDTVISTLPKKPTLTIIK